MRSVSGGAARPISGCDTDGVKYKSTDEMWSKELSGDLYNSETGWYGKSLEYWSKVPATVSGVLGGMEHIHDVDLRASRAFITSLPDRGTARALDCGAGIGRITKHLLHSLYDLTDVLEPVPHMLERAKEELKGIAVGEFILSSMQTAKLPPNTYDLIVIQWAAIYLTDTDFSAFLAHCKRALTPNGYIFFKENCSKHGFVVDKEDSSLTRSDGHYKRIFATAGVHVVKEADQQDWPEDLFAVRMYALRSTKDLIYMAMRTDALPLAERAEWDLALCSSVENILASSHSVLNSARRGSLDADDENKSYMRLNAMFPGVSAKLPEFSAFSPETAPSGVASETLCQHLEECRDVLRQVDSERRFYRERALELQRALEVSAAEVAQQRRHVAESEGRLRRAQRASLDARSKAREAAEQATAAAEDRARLQRVVRSLPMERAEALALVPDRRFEEAFRDKMCAIRYKRRYDGLRRLFERRAEREETERMGAEDEVDGRRAWRPPLPRAHNDEGDPRGLRPGLGTNRWITALLRPLAFTTKTAQDGYVRAVLQRAALGERLAHTREELLQLCARLHAAQEAGLRGVCAAVAPLLPGRPASSTTTSLSDASFMNDGSDVNLAATAPGGFWRSPSSAAAHSAHSARQGLDAALEQTQRAHRDLLCEVVQCVNASVLHLADAKGAGDGTGRAAPTRDASCGAHFPNPAARLAELEGRLARHAAPKPHADTPNAECTRRRAVLTLEQLIALHRAFFGVIAAWAAPGGESAPRDAFAELALEANADAMDDARFETRLSEAVQCDIAHAAALLAAPPRPEAKTESKAEKGRRRGGRRVTVPAVTGRARNASPISSPRRRLTWQRAATTTTRPIALPPAQCVLTARDEKEKSPSERPAGITTVTLPQFI